MAKPKVSICIPAFNQQMGVKRCLLSIKNQSFTDYEVIITDDSNDNSVREVIKSIKEFCLIRYFKNQFRKGNPGNWNYGIDKSQGTYIKIIHHDDWFSNKDSLKEYVSLLDNNVTSDFAFSAAKAISDEGKLVFTHIPDQNQITNLKICREILFFGNFIGCPSATIFRNNNQFRFDTNLKWLVDVDFYIQLLSNNPNFAYSDQPLISVTVNGNNQVSRYFEHNKFEILKESLILYLKIRDKRMGSLRYLKHFLALL